MAVTSQIIQVSSSPTLLGSERTRVVLQAAQGDAVYLGGPDVSTSNGFIWSPLQLGNSTTWVEFNLERGEFLYGVVAGTPRSVWVLTLD